MTSKFHANKKIKYLEEEGERIDENYILGEAIGSGNALVVKTIKKSDNSFGALKEIEVQSDEHLECVKQEIALLKRITQLENPLFIRLLS